MPHFIARWFTRVRALVAGNGSGAAERPAAGPVPVAPPGNGHDFVVAIGAHGINLIPCPTPRRQPQAAPATGTFVVDTARDRLGQVVGREGLHLRLRPPAGGREWEAEPVGVRIATDSERLSAKVKAANSQGRWGK